MPSPVLESPEAVPVAAGPLAADAYVVDAPSTGGVRDARRDVDEAIADARRAGHRAAVCVVDLGLLDARAMHAGVDAVDAMISGHTRRRDRVCRLGRLLVVLAGHLGHPDQGERLAARLRAAAGARAAVGLALFPAHGDDADTLVAAARASASRSRNTMELWPEQAGGAWSALA